MLTVTAIALAMFVAVSCKPKEGGSCRGTAASCVDPASALVCRSGTYVAVECRGRGGCVAAGTDVTCDDSVGAVGDACFGATAQDYACTADGKEALHCRDGRFEAFLPCRGAQGCKLIGRTVSCDTSIANVNDPCRMHGQVSCSADRTMLVQCNKGKFTAYRYCRGRQGCYFSGDIPGCDETRAKDGDPCGIPGLAACSEDGTHEMQCSGSRFTRGRPCRRGPCQVLDNAAQPIACN